MQIKALDYSAESLLTLDLIWSVQIRSFLGRYYPAFRLNTEIYRVSLPIHSECEKNADQMKLRIRTNTTSPISHQCSILYFLKMSENQSFRLQLYLK